MINKQSLLSETVSFNFGAVDSLTRVMVIGQTGLLNEGVDLMLTACKDLEVFHAAYENEAGLTTKVVQIQPGVIVVCHEKPGLGKELVAKLAGIPSLENLRIINIHLTNTALDVYEHHNWFSVSQRAFFRLVYGEQIQSCKCAV